MNPEEKENSQWEGQEPTSLATELVDHDIVKGGTHVLDLGCGFALVEILTGWQVKVLLLMQ